MDLSGEAMESNLELDSASPVRVTRMPAFVEITRPFTLLPPFLGIVSGSFAAIGSLAATGRGSLSDSLGAHWHFILMGGAMAALLNAASNVLNQVTEVEIDRKNKPGRVLPQGRMGVSAALIYSVFLFMFALLLAWLVEPEPGVHHTFWCSLAAALATVAYSVKPVYTKSRGWLANVTIAVPRGCLLKVAGWGCVASVINPEPWFIGSVFMLFLVGAATSKDFSDMDGDGEAGIRTLPVIYGAEKAAKKIAPFFIIPWLFLALGMAAPYAGFGVVMHSGKVSTIIMGLLLAGYGIYISGLMKDSSAHSVEGNHPAWKHMYLMMMAAQIGLVGCYFI
ncbi:MAG: UbiA prenyltransferase family protein [Planctomycetes bacterium]|nr:UbiA prenyltransferase family protein [Planctomycetota bacterium]